MEWRLGDSSGTSNRGTKAKTITSCDNAFVTNIGAVAVATLALRFRAKNICWPETLQRSEAAHRTPPGSFALCESVATATTKRPVGTEIPSHYDDELISEETVFVLLNFNL
ncbi:hypothetical protein [Lysinibacillus sp. NPDC056232]|uniref:hypothetical protein n=1 Tax=Lysinibacillus sp. NPDC056232 TaxID=3345756 RepID=UPI0035D64E5E